MVDRLLHSDRKPDGYRRQQTDQTDRTTTQAL